MSQAKYLGRLVDHEHGVSGEVYERNPRTLVIKVSILANLLHGYCFRKFDRFTIAKTYSAFVKLSSFLEQLLKSLVVKIVISGLQVRWIRPGRLLLGRYIGQRAKRERPHRAVPVHRPVLSLPRSGRSGFAVIFR